ncbi:MAG: PEP-CTERM sorting domain-containing protein [Verrucomicrobiota bacterium]
MKKPLLLLSLSCLLSALAPFSQASASLLAYDGFEDYASGSTLNGSNGGSGDWNAAWVANSAVDINGSGLSYLNGGISLNGGDRSFRVDASSSGTATLLSRSFDTTGGSGEVYFSFLFQATSTGNQQVFNFGLSDDADINNAGTIGDPFSSQPNLAARTRASTSDGTDDSGFSYSNGTTYLLVGRFSTDGSQSGDTWDQMELWINPDSLVAGTADATIDRTAAISGAVIDTINMQTSGFTGSQSFLFDELRIGTSFASVVVPEPSSAGLLLGAASFLVLHRRRSTSPRQTS